MTTTGKLWLGFGLLLLFLIGIGLFVAHRLASIERAIATIMAVQEPASATAYEMALNVSATRSALVAYVADGDRAHRLRISAERAVFERQMQRYMQVAQSPATLERGRQIQQRQADIHLLGDSLMTASDDERDALARFERVADNARAILAHELRPHIDIRGRDAPRKLAVAAQLEANMNGVAAAVGIYRASRDADERARVATLSEETRRTLGQIDELHPSDPEKAAFLRFKSAFTEMVADARDCFEKRDRLQLLSTRFARLSNRLEKVVDEGIHSLARTDLQEAANIAIHSIHLSMLAVLLLLIAGIVIGGVTALPVGQSIVRYESTLRERMGSLAVMHERKDEFLGVLGHELRNPLAPLSNSLHVLEARAEDVPSEIRQTHAMMKRQVDNMTRLVDDLLDVSRINQGKITLQRSPVDLRAVLDDAADDFRPLANARGIELKLVLPANSIWVDADPTRLAQIVANLVNNAVKYTPSGGRITLALVDGREAEVRVSDTGMGIPADMLDRIFEPFTQVEPTITRGHGGLGIGLTLVQRLAEMHGGSVQATSAGRGKGSTFTLRLPRIEAPRTARAERAGSPGDSAPPAAPLAQRILVVDDNQDSADTLGDLLRLWGHEVQLAHDGPQALACAESFRPEIVLLDIGLPGMDGYGVAERLRRESRLPGLLLIALTGFGQHEDRRRSFEAGFDFHLTKPVHPGALRKMIERRPT